MFVDILFENFSRQPADIATAERWTADFRKTNPVFPDDNYAVYDMYDRNNYQPQYILIGRDAVVRGYWSSWQESAITAAIEVELAR